MVFVVVRGHKRTSKDGVRQVELSPNDTDSTAPKTESQRTCHKQTHCAVGIIRHSTQPPKQPLPQTHSFLFFVFFLLPLLGHEARRIQIIQVPHKLNS